MKNVLQKIEELKIALVALLTLNKLAFSAVLSLNNHDRSIFLCMFPGIVDEWEQRLVTSIFVSSDHIQYVSRLWMANDNKKAIIVPVLALDLA